MHIVPHISFFFSYNYSFASLYFYRQINLKTYFLECKHQWLNSEKCLLEEKDRKEKRRERNNIDSSDFKYLFLHNATLLSFELYSINIKITNSIIDTILKKKISDLNI